MSKAEHAFTVQINSMEVYYLGATITKDGTQIEIEYNYEESSNHGNVKCTLNDNGLYIGEYSENYEGTTYTGTVKYNLSHKNGKNYLHGVWTLDPNKNDMQGYEVFIW